MTLSKKHHYIPRFYLKGFTNSNGDFYIYDKKKDEIRKSSPDNSFFEKYRNSAYIGDEKTDLPEKMLAEFDGRTAGVLENIRKAKLGDKVLTPENLYILRFFIATTFWRIPVNDKLREEMIDNNSFKELGFGIFDKDGARSLDAENLLKDTEVFRKIYTSLLPVSSFLNNNDLKNYSDWKVLYRDYPNHITGDNPLILKSDFQDFKSVQKDLIMPLSNDKVLICTDKKIKQSIHSVFNLKMDMIILHQSDRFVCSPSEKYLKEIVDKPYKMSLGKNWDKLMIEDLFNSIENEDESE
jgi:hypothetical protein